MKAKKSLGQNFLKSDEALQAIIEAAELNNDDIVLEIGPGRGALTAELIKTGAKVLAIEKDEALVAYLHDVFAGKSNLSLISGDILEFDPSRHGLSEGNFKLVANIPYYITGEILRKFLSGPIQPSKMVLLVQKEVAERIVADDGRHSILSLSVHAFGNPTFVATVPRTAFDPVPEVDSAIVRINNISRNFFIHTNELAFFEAIHCGFAHKRKLVASNLGEEGKTVLERCKIPPLSRAENLTLENWACISKNMAL